MAMKRKKESQLGFVIPIAGQIHQIYLWRVYQGLEPIRRKMISFWRQANGWMQRDEDLILLSSSSIDWRFLNRCLRKGRSFSSALTMQDEYIPTTPIEWRRRFRECLVQYNIGALLIIYGGTGVALLSELEELNIPIAVNFGGSDAQMGDHNPWYAKNLKRLWKRADMCVFISEFLMRQACQKGCPVEKSRVIYRGCIIPEKHVQFGNDSSVRIICVANHLPVKGHQYLLEAFAHAKKKNRNIRLSLIGDGPLKEQLQLLVQKLGLNNSVRFLGTVRWDKVQNELSCSDIYVQPSIRAADGREEGLGNSVLEAQSLGLPAIVFCSGALVEIIEHDQNGLVVPEKDTRAMSQAIIRLAESPDLRLRMSKAARQKMREKFGLAKINNIWRNTVLELIQKGKK